MIKHLRGLDGGRRGIRTPDPLIKSHEFNTPIVHDGLRYSLFFHIVTVTYRILTIPQSHIIFDLFGSLIGHSENSKKNDPEKGRGKIAGSIKLFANQRKRKNIKENVERISADMLLYLNNK